jgi:DNA repair exonuclease SbcCD ATPase subunit
MATTVPDFAAIALQLETATAQIRALSSVPEAQREGKIMEAIEEVKNKVVGIEEQMKKIGSKLQSLEDTTNNRFVQVKAGSVFRSCVLHRLI